MKVNPNLFSPTTPSSGNTAQVSEARRAFEAMLSASASRSRIQQPAVAMQDQPLSTALRSERVEIKSVSDTEIMPIPRPGRVLDIKV